MITNPFELPNMTLWWGLDSSLSSRLAHTEPISVTAPWVQWDSQNRKFGGKLSRKRQNMLKNPFELPKMTLLWGLDSSLSSRVAHTEPISVTEPWGQRYQPDTNGPNVTVPYKNQNLKRLPCKNDEIWCKFLLQGFIPAHSLSFRRKTGAKFGVTRPPFPLPQIYSYSIIINK